MSSALTPVPAISDDGVYAPILTVLLDFLTPEERLPILEILSIGSRSEREEEA